MIKLDSEIVAIVMDVLTEEVSGEDMTILKDWCYKRDKSGVLFSKLSDPEWLRVHLILFDKIRMEQAKKDVWQRILELFP